MTGESNKIKDKKETAEITKEAESPKEEKENMKEENKASHGKSENAEKSKKTSSPKQEKSRDGNKRKENKKTAEKKSADEAEEKSDKDRDEEDTEKTEENKEEESGKTTGEKKSEVAEKPKREKTQKDTGDEKPKGKKTRGKSRDSPRKGRRRGRGRDRKDGIEKYWTPRTKLGNLVRNGKITTMEQVLNSGLVLRESEIVDILLGEMSDEVIDVNMVQRMTDSGRRVRFAVDAAVGNGNGYVGLGRAHGKEVGPTIRKAIDNAKLNIIPLKRGCGSWECGCGTPHSLPYKVSGKSGSVEVTFMPAPRGVGLAVGGVARKILSLGGLKDMWAITKGQTQTTLNYAAAVKDALQNLSRMRINEVQREKFNIVIGGIEE